jgi:radical SAM protein with 4Fe4S-binding SPASM domain
MYPCAFLQTDRFKAGSLRDNSFQEIWDDSEIYASFRSLRIHSCEECRRFDQCHGGCPAVAWHLKNDINGGDPECLERCVTSIADANKVTTAA